MNSHTQESKEATEREIHIGKLKGYPKALRFYGGVGLHFGSRRLLQKEKDENPRSVRTICRNRD